MWEGSVAGHGNLVLKYRGAAYVHGNLELPVLLTSLVHLCC